MRNIVEKFVFWGALSVFVAVPLVYFPNMVFIFGSAKIFLFFGIVEIILALWAWLLVYDVRYRLPRKALLWLSAPVGFLFALTISGIFGVDVSTSFFGTVNRGTGLIFLYHSLGLAFVLASIARANGMNFINRFLQANVFSGVVIAIVIFFTNFTHVKGTLALSIGGGTLGNTSFAAAYLLFTAFFAVYLLAQSKGWRLRTLYASSAFIMFASPIFFNANIWRGAVSLSDIIASPLILIGEARMATISVVLGVLLTVAIWLILAGKKFVMKAIGILGIVIILSGVGYGAYQLFQSGSLVHTTFVETTGPERFFFWDSAVEGIKEKPILGWGPENYRVVYHAYFDLDVLRHERDIELLSIDRPHNGFLEVFVNGGAVGFVAYLAFLVAFMATVIIAYRRSILSPLSSAILIGMFFAYILQNQLLFDTIMSYIVFFALFGALVGLLYHNSAKENSNIINIKTGNIVAGALTAVMLPAFMFFSIIPSDRVTAITQTIYFTDNHPQEFSGYENLVNSYASRIILNDFGFFMSTVHSTLRGDFQRASTQEERDIISNKALAALEASDKILGRGLGGPVLPSIALQLANLYMTSSNNITEERIAQAKEYAELAVQYRPNNPFVYVSYSQTLAFGGEIEEARAMADKAIELEPNFLSSHNYKVLFERFFGTEESYNQAVEEARVYFPDFTPRGSE